ncbi:MAG: hypothetical protein ACRDT6_18955 [Micromonosporaceae bacterium]
MASPTVEHMTPEQLTGTSLLFPIGHYIGAYHPGAGEPLAYHSIRVGQSRVALRSDEEFRMWALCHGFTGEQNVRPWTRDGALRAASATGLDGARELLDGLLGEDIVVEVKAGTDEAVSFARQHRVVPLLYGVGQTQSDPPRQGIGLGGQVALQVNNLAFELWRFGHLADNLWQFTQLQSEVLRTSAGLSDSLTRPDQLLLSLLWELQWLLPYNAVYLDNATDA